MDDAQTECSADYRDIEFNRDSFLSSGSEIPELSEEEFFQNPKPKSTEKTCPTFSTGFTESSKIMNLQNTSRTSSPPRIPENTPLASVENLSNDIKSMPKLKTELRQKAPSLFDRLFKKDKAKLESKIVNKARSEPREVKSETNYRAQSLPPASVMKNKHIPPPPTIKIQDGKLCLESSKNIPEPMDPDQIYLSNVTRQEPIKLVYGKAPDIIIQEVTNLPDTVEIFAPKTITGKSENISPAPQSPKPSISSIDDVAEKTMMDILDDAIRQLREESNIPIYANKNPSGSLTRNYPSKREDCPINTADNSTKKRKTGSSFKLPKSNFLKKFEKKPLDDVPKPDDEKRSESPELFNSNDYNKEPIDDEPVDDIEMLDDKPSEDGMAKIFSNAKNKLKGKKKDFQKKLNDKLPSFKVSSEKLLKKPSNKQDVSERDLSNQSKIKNKSFLPKTSESPSSTLGNNFFGHNKTQLQTPVLGRKNSNPKAIEIEIGIPLDAPYEEYETPTLEKPSLNIFRQYPKEESKIPPVEKKNQNRVPDINIAKLPGESPEFDMKIPEFNKFDLVKMPEDVKTPNKERAETVLSSPVQDELSEPTKYKIAKLPEIIVKTPENAKLAGDYTVNKEEQLAVQSTMPTQKSDLFYQHPALEPEITFPRTPDIEITPASPIIDLDLLKLPLEDIKDVGITYEPPELEEPEGKTKIVKEKVEKLRNIAGSFGQSFKTKIKDLMPKKQNPSTQPKVVNTTIKPNAFLKETSLDDYQEMPEDYNIKSEFNILDQYRVDTTVDDEEPVDHEINTRRKIFRKFKVPVLGSTDPKNPEMPTFYDKNRERLQQIRNRAQKSFNQFTDKIKQQKQSFQERTTVKSMKSKPERPPVPNFYRNNSYDSYLHVASDSELSPGAGLESLRCSKVLQELVEAQERLDMYMTPIDRHGPLRPPRRKPINQIDEEKMFNRSLPSLSRLPKPPRPPPPIMNSVCSIPCDDEIPLDGSTSSLNNIGDKHRQRFPRKQRVPPDMFYRNVRLGYRPKKSYVELLQKSQPFYSMIGQQQSQLERSQSTGQLYGQHKNLASRSSRFPVPPLRKSRQFDKMENRNYTMASKPPIYPGVGSRATSVASNHQYIDFNLYSEDEYEQAANLEPSLFERNDYKPVKQIYLPKNWQTNYGTVKTDHNPLNWEPYTWKVKRCRSFTELEVRDRLKRKNINGEESLTDTKTILTDDDGRNLNRSRRGDSVPKQNKNPQTLNYQEQNSIQIPKKIFQWLQNSTSASLESLKNHYQKQNATKSPTLSPPPRPRPPAIKPINANINDQFLTDNSLCSNISNNTATCSSLSCQDHFYLNNMNNNNNYNNVNFFTDNKCLEENNGHWKQLSLKTNQPQRIRPLPPPPVPPRPRLIPSHYAINNRRRPDTRDVACDTSENGFQQYCEQQIQNERQKQNLLINDKNDYVNSIGNNYHRKKHYEKHSLINETEDNDEDIDEELTLVEENKQNPSGLNCSSICSYNSNTDDVTVASVYVDAKSHQTNTTSNVGTNTPSNNHRREPPLAKQWSSEGDDDTLNDDLSSLSSNYQSILEPSLLVNTTKIQPVKNDSFLHRNSSSTLSTNTQNQTAQQFNKMSTTSSRNSQTATITNTDDYQTATSNTNDCNNTSQQIQQNNHQTKPSSSLSLFSSDGDVNQCSSAPSTMIMAKLQFEDNNNNNTINNNNNLDFEQFNKHFDGLLKTTIDTDATMDNENVDVIDEPDVTIQQQQSSNNHQTSSNRHNDDDDDDKNRQVFFIYFFCSFPN